MDFLEKDAKVNMLWGSIREYTLTERIIRRLNKKKIHKLADMGCGDGYFLYSIIKKRKDIDEIYAVDMSNTRLKRVEKISRRIIVLKADIKRMPFPDNFFDVTICSEVLEHLEGYEKAIKELLRVTKRQLIITVPNDQQPIKILCPYCRKYHYLSEHINRFDKGEIKKLIEKLASGRSISMEFEKFHTIYSYNRITMKLPQFLRISIDKIFISLEGIISFFKPNYLMVVVTSKDR